MIEIGKTTFLQFHHIVEKVIRIFACPRTTRISENPTGEIVEKCGGDFTGTGWGSQPFPANPE